MDGDPALCTNVWLYVLCTVRGMDKRMRAGRCVYASLWGVMLHYTMVDVR